MTKTKTKTKTIVIVDGEKLKYKHCKWQSSCWVDHEEVEQEHLIVDGVRYDIATSDFKFNYNMDLIKIIVETVANCRHDFLAGLRPTQNGYKTDQFCLKCHQWKSQIGVSPSTLARMSNMGHGT